MTRNEREPLWGPVAARLITDGDKRMEARSYLTDGFGLRNRLATSKKPTIKLAEAAYIWQPPRLKSYPALPGSGLPYLSAGQMFEDEPRVRKWLAKAMVSDPDSLRVSEDLLLMSRSGEVGKVTAVYDAHLGAIVTDDLLRIRPGTADDIGWLYALLRTPSFRSITQTAKYGHMIKHLEPHHLNNIDIPWPEAHIRSTIGGSAAAAIGLRRDARRLQKDADALFAAQFSPSPDGTSVGPITTARISELSSGRRRLDAQHHSPGAISALAHLGDSGVIRVDRLESLVQSVSLGQRFKRFFSADGGGTPYQSAGDLFDVNPPENKRIYAALLDDPERYILQEGWIVMACSGQTYGLLGRSRILSERDAGVFGSHDLIRIVPDDRKARAGYLQTVLNSELIGRPLIIRHAFGTSIPHLDPVDIRNLEVPRLPDSIENEIATLSLRSTLMRADANRLEDDATSAADEIISEWLLAQ